MVHRQLVLILRWYHYWVKTGPLNMYSDNKVAVIFGWSLSEVLLYMQLYYNMVIMSGGSCMSTLLYQVMSYQGMLFKIMMYQVISNRTLSYLVISCLFPQTISRIRKYLGMGKLLLFHSDTDSAVCLVTPCFQQSVSQPSHGIPGFRFCFSQSDNMLWSLCRI